jgi:exonuclease SbcD
MDIHISEKNIDLIYNQFEQIIKHCLENGIKHIIQAGDVFDSRKGQPVSTLTCFSNILEKLDENGILMYCIPGNHDKVDYESSQSYLDVFRHFPSLYLMSDLSKLDFLHGHINFIMLPFFKEDTILYSKILEAHNLIDENKINVLITHCAIKGVKNNDGSLVDNRITSQLLKKFDKVLVAHYHNEQEFDNIHYLGSLYQANFGEDEKKGFWTISNNCKLTHHKTQFPLYKKISINVKDYSPEQIEEIVLSQDTKNDNIRVVLKGTFEEINAIDKNKIKQHGVDVKLEASEIQISIEEASEEKFVSFDKGMIQNEFEEFCKSNDFKNLEIGKKYLTKILN